jgi:outer membrane protein insertion porin family
VLAHTRAIRLIAWCGIVLLAVPLVLSTTWAKSFVLERASAWAGSRFGVDVRATRLDYSLTALSFRLEEVSIADRTAAGQPFFRAAQVEIDLAASALGGRLDVDRIHLRRPSIVLDSTTRPRRPAGTPDSPPRPRPAPFPLFEIGTLEIEGLDLVAGDENGTRVAVRQMTSTLRGSGPQRLEGELAAHAGVDVTFGTDVIRVAFDRADARVVLDGGKRLLTGSLTASSPVSELRAEGDVPLDAVGILDLRYDATGHLEEIGRWWRDAPQWNGPATLKGRVRGPLRTPEATFEATSMGFHWSPLVNARLDVAGQVSADKLDIATLSMASRQGTLDVRGRLDFTRPGRSLLDGRWKTLDPGLVGKVLGLPPGSVPRAVLAGSASLGWPGRVPAVTTVEGRLEATAYAADPGTAPGGAPAAPEIAATGTLAANGQSGRWQVAYRQSLDGRTRASLEGVVTADEADLARSNVTATIELHTESVDAALAQLQRVGLQFPSAVNTAGADQLRFEGTLAGPLGGLRMSGRIAAPNARVGPWTGLDVLGSLSVDANAITVSPLAIDALSGEVLLDGTLPWRHGSGQGTITAHLQETADLAVGVPDLWRPAGALEVSGEWTGTALDPAVTARVSSPGIGINGLMLESVSAVVSLADRLFTVSDLTATQPGGTLTASGSWNLKNTVFDAKVTARNLVMSLVEPGPAGSTERGRLNAISVDAELTGPLARPEGIISLAAGSTLLDGRALGAVTARVDATGGVARITAGVPEYGATIDGRLTLDRDWPFAGRVALEGSDLAGLVRLAGVPDEHVHDLAASLDATIDLSGTAEHLADTSGAIAVTRLEGQMRGRTLALSQPGRARIESGVARVAEPMRLTFGATAFELAQSVEEAPGAELALRVDGPIADLISIAPGLVATGVTAEGTLSAEVLLGERLSTLQPTGRATLDIAALRRDEQELARDVRAAAKADTQAIRVDRLTGTVLGSPFEGQATVPASWIRGNSAMAAKAGDTATFSLKSTVAVAPVLAALRPEMPGLTGSLNVTVEGTATAPRLDAVRATLEEHAGEMTIGAIKLNSHRTTALRLEAGLLNVDGFEWRGPESTIVASGSVGIADGMSGHLHLDGEASLALLNLVVPARVGGQSTFDVEVSGPPGARELAGTIGIQDGSMVVQPWRLALADWSGTVVLDATGIAVQGLHGQLNGGEATVDGRLPVGRGSADGHVLTVSVRSAFLDVPRGLRSQLDTDLAWTRVGNGARLSGRATVTARTYREPVTELARIASALLEQSRGAPTELPEAFAATTLDVRLGTIGPLAMTNSVARVEMMPELQLTGTMGRPALNGQIAVADDGRIQVGGRQYRLRDSRVEFRPELGLTPRLDITGNTRVGDYTVFLKLTGSATQIETSLMSDPPLGERDLRTLLVTGQLESMAQGGDADTMAVGAVSGDVLGFAGQFLGFDSVVVGTSDDLALVSSDVDPALRLTVSKRIGNRFELVLSDNLDDNELTWVIIYRPRPGFEFRAISRGASEYTGEFRQEIPFGPGVSPPRITARRRVARERIASVTISGDPGLPEADVLSSSRQRSGDHFDFGRWVEDREQIARLYLERGYFAARIVQTRRTVDGAAGESRVALDYRITRGPRTLLSVSGYDPPPALMDQLRQAWSDSLLVELLDADLSQVMRGHLSDLGYLQATVKVEVDRAEPDQLRAVVRVEPGPVTLDRHLTFSGNTAISDEELLTAAGADTLASSAWKNPAPLLEAIEATYALRGYLAARATTQAIVFSGSSATLPVHVDEGPVARIATLTVSGAERVAQTEAAAATGLTVGATYVGAGEQSIRRSLERYYRDLGYRDVSVEARATVNAAQGRVDIVATVHEGPRYVVQSVRTTGVETTREALVERATRMEPGSPASPALADATRRQLYDIGTFRSAEVTFEPTGTPPTAATVPVDAVVAVQESRRFLFLYGLEATNQYEPLFDKRISSGGLAADLRDRNFLGRGWTLGAGLRYEPSFQSGRVLMSIPRLGLKRIRTNVYVDTRTEDRARTEDIIFRDDETSLTIEQRWRVRAPVELSWGYRYNYRDIRFLAAETEQPLVRFSGHLAGLASAIVVDRRDNMFDARKGWLFSASTEWGLQAVGSDFDYLRSLVRASFYQPLGPLTLASNTRWGNLEPFGGQPPISVLDLFYQAGGTQTVRGYKQDSLSAYELLGSPIGGSKLLVFNQEVRFPLFWLLSGVAFADAGNTFTDGDGIALGDLAVGLGFGLRIRTPLAPIRIDLGFPKWGNPTGSTSARWHFSIGQVF